MDHALFLLGFVFETPLQRVLGVCMLVCVGGSFAVQYRSARRRGEREFFATLQQLRQYTSQETRAYFAWLGGYLFFAFLLIVSS